MGDSIQELAGGIQKLGSSGALVALSRESVQDVVNTINKVHAELLEQKNALNGKRITGSPGGYQQSKDAKDALNHDLDAIDKVLDKYLEYLIQYKDAVKHGIGGIVDNG